jgi:hypothetical protein
MAGFLFGVCSKCCEKECDCNTFFQDASLQVTFNGVEITNSFFSFGLTDACSGVMSNPSLCPFTSDQDECHLVVWRDWVCKDSQGLPSGYQTYGDDGQLEGIMEEGGLYLMLTLFMDAGPLNSPVGCVMLNEHRIYKLKQASSDCCDVELEIVAIGNLRGDPGRGTIQWTAANFNGYPLPSLEDPESCSCFSTFFLDPVVTVDCNPLP